MKERLLKKIKRWLIIILLFVVILGVIVIVKYNQNPQGLMEELDRLYAKTAQMASDLYGKNLVKENIVLPEKENLTEAQKYFYFQQLSEPAKKIYVTIENNIDKMMNGEDNIPLPSSLNDVANEKGKEYVSKEFQSAWDAFITDKSEYFYIDSSKVCLVSKITTRGNKSNYEFFIGKGDNSRYFIDEFKSKEEIEKAKLTLENQTKNIIAGATGNNYEKMLYIHDWLVNNTEYEDIKGSNTANIYGCIVNHKALCEGYARSFKYLMDKLEIPCVLVSGDAIGDNGKVERHAWNYVYINNNWYAIDVTWDDPIIIGNGRITDNIKYKYFLKGSKTMVKDHTTSGSITKDGMEFEYPKLAEDDLR